jgi:hypothetical protein
LRPEPALPSSSSFQKTRNEEEEECKNENSSRRKEKKGRPIRALITLNFVFIFWQQLQGTFERTREGEKE